MTKSEAIERAHAPSWLIDQFRARRCGEPVVSPRLRSGWIEWLHPKNRARRLPQPLALTRRARSSADPVDRLAYGQPAQRSGKDS